MMKLTGPFSNKERALILKGINSGLNSIDIQKVLLTEGYDRKLKAVESNIKKVKEADNIKVNKENTDSLRVALHSKEYWTDLKRQFNTAELKYFEALWVSLMQQFKSDVRASEEMQLKQYIILDILIARSLMERKKQIEEVDKLDNVVAMEYKKDEDKRDGDLISRSETQLAYLRNSVSSYTTEHVNLLAKLQAIGKDLKANREARIKNIEDSKSTFSNLIRSLEDEELRERMGDETELMKLAKDNTKNKLIQWHEYIDGKVDQPLLIPEEVKSE